MSAQHTPGRVKVQHPDAGERGWEVAFEPGLERLCADITEANARRLVACWNALQDFSTVELENSRFKPVSNGNWGGQQERPNNAPTKTPPHRSTRHNTPKPHSESTHHGKRSTLPHQAL